MRRTWIQSAIILASCFLFLSNGFAKETNDTLRLLFWQAPTMLNPHLTGSFKDWNAARITYEPLAAFDKDGNLIPFLAAEMPSIENGGLAKDGKSVIWKLKPGIKWSDGQPFSADDVLFTYKFATNPEINADSAYHYTAVERVEVIDDLTIKVHFKTPTPSWHTPFSGRNGILPRHVFQAFNNKNAERAPANLAPVGTGPYRFVEYNAEEMLLIGDDVVEMIKIIYEPNPFYRKADKVQFRRIELVGGGGVTHAAQSVFLDGTGDFAWNLQIDPEELAKMEEGGKGNVLAVFGADVEKIVLNFSDPNRATETGLRSYVRFPHPILSDKNVRQAIAHAVDRKKIAALYGKTARVTTNTLVSPSIYDSPNTQNLYPFDLKKAAALLREAGWEDTDSDGIREKNGLELKLLFQTSVNSLRQQTQRIVKEDMEAIGIEVELKYIEGGVFFKHDPANTNSVWHFYADMEMFYAGNRDPDPHSFMAAQYCKIPGRPADSWKGINLPRWCDPRYEKMYEQAAEELDPAIRTQLFIRMNDLVVEEVVHIPLVNRATVNAVSNTLDGIELTPWDSVTWKIQDWKRK